MSTTPPILRPGQESMDLAGDCWIDLTHSSISPLLKSPENERAITSIPLFKSPGEYLHLLREAQESNQSSRVVSQAGSRHASPASPPNSPIHLLDMPRTDIEYEQFLKDIYINDTDDPLIRVPRTQHMIYDSDSRDGLSRPRGNEWSWINETSPILTSPIQPIDLQYRPMDFTKSGSTYSIRRGRLIGMCSSELLVFSVVSLFTTICIGFTFGYYIGRNANKCICM